MSRFEDVHVLGCIIACFFFVMEIIYLRNKETQQTLQVIVSIQYDASFSANDIYP